MRSFFFIIIIGLAAHGTAAAEFITYTNKASWMAAAPAYSTITFTEFPATTLVTDHYGYLGVQFTDGSDYIYHSSSFVTDGAGLNGAFDETTLEFDSPMTAIAVEFPGLLRIRLFLQGTLIYTSPAFGTMPTGNFAGLVSAVPFDAALLDDPLGGLFIDNLHFGPPIPAPGALALFGVAAMALSRRRRTT